MKEYLPQLQSRQKWSKDKGITIKPGTMIVIKEDNAPPTQWPLGCVTEVHPGKDDIVRVVSIHTARGIIKRLTTKICVLPIEDNSKILDIN